MFVASSDHVLNGRSLAHEQVPSGSDHRTQNRKHSREEPDFVPSILYDPEGQEDLFRDFSQTTHFSSLGLPLISKMWRYISLFFKVGQTQSMVLYFIFSHLAVGMKLKHYR